MTTFRSAALLFAAVGGGAVGGQLLLGRLLPTLVASNSMAPTYLRGDLLVSSVVQARCGEITRGSVVVFAFPHGTSTLAIKRVAAIGGDVVTRVASDVEFETNDPDCAAIPRSTDSDLRAIAPTGRACVTPGYVFLLGDNVSSSIDSRNFGLVPLSDVRAVVRFGLPVSRWWPPGLSKPQS